MTKTMINGKPRVVYASKIVRSKAQLTEMENRRVVRAAVTELKRKPCKDCGGTFDPVCMDFDHRPHERKVESVSKLIWAGIEAVLREIAKCDLVCANCHRLRTHRRNHAATP